LAIIELSVTLIKIVFELNIICNLSQDHQLILRFAALKSLEFLQVLRNILSCIYKNILLLLT
jgi:hypothetical protein